MSALQRHCEKQGTACGGHNKQSKHSIIYGHVSPLSLRVTCKDRLRLIGFVSSLVPLAEHLWATQEHCSILQQHLGKGHTDKGFSGRLIYINFKIIICSLKAFLALRTLCTQPSRLYFFRPSDVLGSYVAFTGDMKKDVLRYRQKSELLNDVVSFHYMLEANKEIGISFPFLSGVLDSKLKSR